MVFIHLGRKIYIVFKKYFVSIKAYDGHYIDFKGRYTLWTFKFKL